MARTKKIKEAVKISQEVAVSRTEAIDTILYANVIPKVLPLTQEFGNGDMNVLRDKINEIIKANS